MTESDPPSDRPVQLPAIVQATALTATSDAGAAVTAAGAEQKSTLVRRDAGGGDVGVQRLGEGRRTCA
jgi:hypothetical protein